MIITVDMLASNALRHDVRALGVALQKHRNIFIVTGRISVFI